MEYFLYCFILLTCSILTGCSDNIPSTVPVVNDHDDDSSADLSNEVVGFSPAGEDQLIDLLHGIEKVAEHNHDNLTATLQTMVTTVYKQLVHLVMEQNVNSTLTAAGGTVVELPGWRAESGIASIAMQSYMPSGSVCLSFCLHAPKQSSGCRMVNYHHNNTAWCQGYLGDGTMNPRLIRDADYSILALSSKKFSAKEGVNYPGQDIRVTGMSVEDRTLVLESNGALVDVGSPAVCMELCRVYAQCNVASYSRKTGHCLLKTKTTLNPQLDSDVISFIS